MPRLKRNRKFVPKTRHFSLDPLTYAFVAMRKDINWSEVVENYLKVYIHDLQQQEERDE